MKKIIIIQSIIIGIFIFYFYFNFLIENTKVEQSFKNEKVSLFKDVPSEYKGRINTPNRDRRFYENKKLGFLVNLPSPIQFYGEMIKNSFENDEKESYVISFYTIPNSLIFPISLMENIDPITAIEIKIIPDEFSSLDGWINFQKNGTSSDYFATRTLSNVIIDGEKAIRIIDTLDNRPNFEDKYNTQERTLIYHNNKIFDISIYTSEINSKNDINLIWDSFKFLDSE